VVKTKRLRQKSSQLWMGVCVVTVYVVQTGFGNLLHHVGTTCLEYDNILMADGPKSVVKWILGVANNAGSLHLVCSMPWAAMWATEIRSLLGVVGILSKKTSNLGARVS
jgi:hypothetical protein